MKTATIPPLRVEPQLRETIERLLGPGETLSAFIEQAILHGIERRAGDEAFAAKALAAREASRKSGRTHSAASVLRDLEATTAAARRRPGKRG
jgi:hypothetical protein